MYSPTASSHHLNRMPILLPDFSDDDSPKASDMKSPNKKDPFKKEEVSLIFRDKLSQLKADIVRLKNELDRERKLSADSSIVIESLKDKLLKQIQINNTLYEQVNEIIRESTLNLNKQKLMQDDLKLLELKIKFFIEKFPIHAVPLIYILQMVKAQ